MKDLTTFSKEKLSRVIFEGKLRSLQLFSDQIGTNITCQNKRLISFATNDYFGLAQHDVVKKTAIEAIDLYGVGAKSSRLVCANDANYIKLEKNLAKVKNTDKAVVFGSGYLTSIGVIPTLVKKGDLIVVDKLIHACLLDGIKLSGADLQRFKHNDYDHCERILKNQRHKYKNCLIISETIFSMDGDLADIEILGFLAKKYQSWLLTDDAHGFGIVKQDINDDYIKNNYIQLGTLSKGLGAYGGYMAGSKDLCAHVTTKANSLIYTTALPYTIIVAANQALKILLKNSGLQDKLQSNIDLFCNHMDLPKQISPIFKITFPSIKKLQDKHQNLIENGFYVSMIRPPTSPTPRLRISLSALHTKEQIEGLCNIL